MTNAINRSVPPQRLVKLINPLVRTLLRSPLHAALDRAVLVLHLTGRRTGRHYDIPVGYVPLDGRFIVITQHSWRANLRGGADLDVTRTGHREPMHAELDEAPASVAATLHTLIERIGWQAARRQIGLTVKAGRVPTTTELEQAVRQYHLATITLTPR